MERALPLSGISLSSLAADPLRLRFQFRGWTVKRPPVITGAGCDSLGFVRRPRIAGVRAAIRGGSLP